MKKALITLVLFLGTILGFSQNLSKVSAYEEALLVKHVNKMMATPVNDLIGNATTINACGTSFTASNYGATAQTNACNMTQNAQGAFSAVYADLDCNDATGNQCTGGPCPDYPGGDVTYSVENDIWYKFCPSVVGTYSLSISSSSCTTASGFQSTVFQGTPTNLSTNLGTGSAGNNATVIININVTSTTNCVYIQIDGYAGTQCNFNVSLTACASCCSALPIELVSFTGDNYGDFNLLKWLTATETNNDFFTIEKSFDGVEFYVVGKVDGAGNSLELKQYSLVDNKPNDITYYRLKQTDFNGDSKTSSLIAVTRNTSEKDFKLIRITNVLGQDVSEDSEGVKIYYFSNGTVLKKYDMKER